MNLKALTLLSLTITLASPVVAQQFALSIPAPIPQERVFSSEGQAAPIAPMPMPMPAPIPAASVDPTFSEPFHGEIVPGPVYVEAAPEPLFTRVKYVDKREMHPCAVTKIVRVNDPCARKGACGEKCVYIQICVPPCDCEEDIRCRRRGDRMRYDYGKYKVDIRVRKGYIVVDYQK